MHSTREHLSGPGEVYDASGALVANVQYRLGITQGARQARSITGEIYITQGRQNLGGIRLLILKLGPTSRVRFTLVAGDPRQGYYTIQLADAPGGMTI